VAQDWNEYAERIRVQLPAAPEPLLDFYVKYMPWLAIIGGVLGLFFGVIVGVLGLIVATAAAATGSAGSGVQIMIGIILIGVGSALGIAGGYFMLQRRLTGWWILAVSMIINLLDSLVGINILGLLIVIVFAYIHLSVKPRYS
jgi:hypothetical protein